MVSHYAENKSSTLDRNSNNDDDEDNVTVEADAVRVDRCDHLADAAHSEREEGCFPFTNNCETRSLKLTY